MPTLRWKAVANGLEMEKVRCCLCGVDDADPVAVGEDFEYHTSPEVFRAVRCRRCDLVYLDPRPTASEAARIYPADYHAYDFTPESFGIVHAVRRRLEARRMLSWCEGLADDARILDVGCGDGFHLGVLKEFGRPGWRLEGVDPDPRAVEAGQRRGFTMHQGTIGTVELPRASFDLALLIMTIEHVDDPIGVLEGISAVLRPGGRCVIVTDNVDSPDFRVFGGRHWGGYHFPRHFTLFGKRTLQAAAARAGFEVESLRTIVSPVNWVYSIRNLLVDLHAPDWVVERFSLKAPGALAAFTLLDAVNARAGRGAVLNAILRRPANATESP
jgi:SAM-dependent methyltransferase